MFVRFRQTACRLQMSLIETRRVGGKVRHEHIASLGSVVTPPSVEDRIAFWTKLHERLAKLANRVDADTLAKVLGAIHAHIPMVTLDEQRTLKLENAEADERFWSGIHDMHAGTVADHEGLAATAERKITRAEPRWRRRPNTAMPPRIAATSRARRGRARARQAAHGLRTHPSRGWLDQERHPALRQHRHAARERHRDTIRPKVLAAIRRAEKAVVRDLLRRQQAAED